MEPKVKCLPPVLLALPAPVHGVTEPKASSLVDTNCLSEQPDSLYRRETPPQKTNGRLLPAVTIYTDCGLHVDSRVLNIPNSFKISVLTFLRRFLLSSINVWCNTLLQWMDKCKKESDGHDCVHRRWKWMGAMFLKSTNVIASSDIEKDVPVGAALLKARCLTAKFWGLQNTSGPICVFAAVAPQ